MCARLRSQVSESEYYVTMAHDLVAWRCHLASASVPVLLVDYEDLLAEPQKQLRRVVDFSGYGSVSDAALAYAVAQHPVEPHSAVSLAQMVPNA